MTNRRKFPEAKIKLYDSELVFAASCAAQRINGEYVKYYVSNPNGPGKIPNAEIIMNVLKGKMAVTEEDYLHAVILREHFQMNYLVEVLSETANSYIMSAVAISNESHIGSNNIALVASMPQSYRRYIVNQIKSENREKLLSKSKQIGKIGDKVTGLMTIVDQKYIKTYETYVYSALIGDNVVEFWKNIVLGMGVQYNIQGKVKDYYENITKLNYIKIKGIENI